MGRRVYRNYYKGHMDKNQGGEWKHRKEDKLIGWGGREWWGEIRTTVIEQQYKVIKKTLRKIKCSTHSTKKILKKQLFYYYYY